MKPILAFFLLLTLLAACAPLPAPAPAFTPTAAAALPPPGPPVPVPTAPPTQPPAAPTPTLTAGPLPSAEPALPNAGIPLALAGHPQKGYLAVAGWAGVFVYQVSEPSAQVTLLWSAHVSGPVGPRRLAFSPTGDLLLLSTPSSLSLWDSAAGKLRWAISLPDPSLGESGEDPGLFLDTFAFTADQGAIATVNGYGEIILRASDSGQVLKRLPTGSGSSPAGLAFSPDGKYLASASGWYLIVFDLAAGLPLWSALPQKDGIVTGQSLLTYAPDGRTLYSAGQELMRWDALTGDLLGRYSIASPSAMRFSPDGATLALSMGCDGLALWDVAKQDHSACLLKGSSLFDLAYVTAHLLAVSGSGGQVTLVDAESQQPRAVLADFPAPAQTGFAPVLLAPQPAPTAVPAPTLPAYPHRAILVDNIPPASGALPLDLAFTPAGDLRVATGMGLYHLDAQGMPALDLRWKKQPSVVFLSADGSKAGAAAASENGTLSELWDASKLQYLRSITTPPGDSFGAPAFSLDGARLAVKTGEDIFQVQDARTGKAIVTWQDPSLRGLIYENIAFAPDGRSLAAGLWQSIHLFDLASRAQFTSTFGCRSNVIFDQAYSPDGQWLAIACAPQETQLGFFVLVRAADHQVVQFWDEVWQAHSLAFSPDGSILTMGMQTGDIFFFDMRTPNAAGFPSLRQLGSFPAHAAPVFRLAFSPDGAHLASASRTGEVFLWDIK